MQIVQHWLQPSGLPGQLQEATGLGVKFMQAAGTENQRQQVAWAEKRRQQVAWAGQLIHAAWARRQTAREVFQQKSRG